MICEGACASDRPLEDFPRLKQFQRVADASWEQRRHTCKACIRKEQQQALYQADKQGYRDKADRWRKANPDARKRIARDYARKRRWEKLGVTQEWYDARMEEGGNACIGCQRPFDVKVPACTDHCHTCHELRGLLCHACNLVLGNARDDAAALRRLADYLERHACG